MAKAENSASAAICILCRNCQETLPWIFQQTDLLAEAFDDCRVYITENNSTDRTKDMILYYASRRDNVVLRSFDDTAMDTLPTVEKMARLRNMTLESVKTSGFVPEILFMIDGDVVPHADNILRALRDAPSDWRALFANGQYYCRPAGHKVCVAYYDLFALLLHTDESDALTEKQMHVNRVRVQQLLRKADYVPCRSAFGGVGIYRYTDLAALEYRSEKNPNAPEYDEICEHISVNIRIPEPKYICKNMLVHYENLQLAWMPYIRQEDRRNRKEARVPRGSR